MLVAAAAGSGPPPVVTAIIVIVAVAAYWAPTIIGSVRHVPNVGSVAVINFFAFLLLVPWIVALAMAVRTKPPAASGPPS